MAGETQYPRPRVLPTGTHPAAQAESDKQSVVALSARAPRWLLPSLLALAIGGTGGSAVVAGLTTPPPPVVHPIGVVTQSDLDRLTAQTRTDAAQVKADLAQDRAQNEKQIAHLSAQLAKLDAKLDQLHNSVVELKVAVAELRANQRKTR